MRSRRTAVAALAALILGGVFGGGVAARAAEPATPCDPTAKACVSLSTGQAWLQQDGQVTYGPVPIAAGKPETPTPAGRFHVQWKDIDHRSGEFGGAPMPYAVFFTTNGVAFHQGSLQRQSNGCVRLSTSAAPKFFDALQPADEVQVVP